MDHLRLRREGAAALDPDQEALLGQDLKGLPDGGAADAQLCGQLVFSGELLPRPVNAAGQFAPQPVRDLLVKRLCHVETSL